MKGLSNKSLIQYFSVHWVHQSHVTMLNTPLKRRELHSAITELISAIFTMLFVFLSPTLGLSQPQRLLPREIETARSPEIHCLCYRDLSVSAQRPGEDDFDEPTGDELRAIPWVTSCRGRLKSCQRLQARFMSWSLFAIEPLWFQDVDEVPVTPCVSLYGALTPQFWFTDHTQWRYVRGQRGWYYRGQCLIQSAVSVEMLRYHEGGRIWFNSMQRTLGDLIFKLSRVSEVFTYVTADAR